MVEIEVSLPARILPASIPGLVEQACADELLTCTLRTTLAGYPGSLHWHFKRSKERGTLEITWWEQANRLWFKVAAGRRGEWIEAAVVRLRASLERAT